MEYENTLKASPYHDETHQEWRRQVRRFVKPESEPRVQAWDTESGIVPRELFRKAGDPGMYGIGYPEEYGGLGEGFDIFHDMIVMEELRRCGSGGGASVIRGNNIERIYREARIFAIAGGAEEILRDLAVRQLGI